MIDAAWKDIRFSLRRLLIVITAIAVLLAGFAWFDEHYREPFRRNRLLREQLKGLALRRPPELTPKQWESAVAWTINLHGNSLLPFEADARTIRSFQQRLETKLQGKVDLDTIHWIWNEYAGLCPHGKSYQRFHAQMMEEIEAGGSNWGITVP